MLSTFFVAMLSCTSLDCHEEAFVIHPVPLTLERCETVAQEMYDEFSALIKMIGCKEQGKEELEFWIVRAPEL